MFPITLLGGAVLIYFFELNKTYNKWILTIFFIVTGTLLVKMQILNNYASAMNKEKQLCFKETFDRLKQGQNYFSWGNAIQWEGIDPYDNLKKISKYNINPIGSGMDHPLVLKKFNKYNVNFFNSIVNDVIFVIKEDDIKIINENLKEYYIEHLNRKVSINLIDKFTTKEKNIVMLKLNWE